MSEYPIRSTEQLRALLQQLRHQAGWSQRQFGERIGLSQERISAIENHPERITVDQFLTVLMALDAEMAIGKRRPPAPDSPW